MRYLLSTYNSLQGIGCPAASTPQGTLLALKDVTVGCSQHSYGRQAADNRQDTLNA